MTICEIGYIYSIILDNKPVYIGQTINPKVRFKNHRYNIKNNKIKTVYKMIDYYRNNINQNYKLEFKILKCCKLSELDLYEKKAIKYSLEKGYKIFNDCVYTNRIKYELKKNTQLI